MPTREQGDYSREQSTRMRGFCVPFLSKVQEKDHPAPISLFCFTVISF